ncbi:MAG: HAD-IIIA family hydrolase [Candidatus Omnitrophica bacterium]|nr:HAD-IIIA family hydrolase [Candidatus Omnitrophota bacterium]HOX54643.1 HAD-IIIA family hydrolase [Candidatus Omnitrophota bacterium]
MIQDKARKVKLLILDVDGVLTDGKIVMDEKGKQLKFFDVQDGLGVVLLKRAGINTIILSARYSRVVSHRAKDIKIFKAYQNCDDKLLTYHKILKQMKLKNESVCFIGDELIDIPVLKRAGLSVAVANAAPEAKRAADYITKKKGGDGAVREIIELILKSQGKWDKVISKYFR